MPFPVRRNRGGSFGSPAARAALEHMTMMQEAVEHGADCGDIAEQFAPVLDFSGEREDAEDAADTT